MSPSPVFQSVRIDAGRHDGVTLGAAVVNYQGVIGRIAAVGEFHSDVMLLVDGNSSMDVLVQRTRARARVRGFGDDNHLGVEVQYFARTADVEPGDVLVTSGLGDVFPKGLRVGRVVSVERRAFGLYQHASVVPSVDFARLEMAMVILDGWAKTTDFEATPPPPVPAAPASEVPLAGDGALSSEQPPDVLGATPLPIGDMAPTGSEHPQGMEPSVPAPTQAASAPKPTAALTPNPSTATGTSAPAAGQSPPSPAAALPRPTPSESPPSPSPGGSTPQAP
jgi:hypothetical protein